MEKIFEALDEKVFTPELKAELKESFDAAVDEALNEKEVALTEKYEEIFESAKAEYKAELLEKVNSYLERVVEDFIKENEEKLTESIKGQKLDTLLEGFDSLLVTAGIELDSKLNESAPEEKTSKLEEKVNELIIENEELKSERSQMLKLGLIKEAQEGLSELEKTKFDRLAMTLDFNESKAKEFIGKLDLIKESVTSQNLDESAQDKHTEVQNEKIPSWKRHF